MRTLSPRVSELIRACFPGLWVETHEHLDAIREITALCREEDWRLATWDLESGTDPLTAVRSLESMATPDGTALLVLQNFHRFLQSAEIVQALVRQLNLGKQQRTFIVILSPVVQIPVELEKLFVVLEHALPDRAELEVIARGIGTEAGELPEGEALQTLLDAASGLTRNEAESAFSLSLVRHGRLTPDVVWELKCQTLKKSGLLTLHRGTDTFDSLGGLTALKAFTSRALQHGRTHRPRGVLLLSPPGCGKSQFCKTLGNEVGRPVLILDVGSLMGSLVGQSEERTRQALRIIDAMAPCVAMIDEVEKAFAGVGNSSDSGVSAGCSAPFCRGSMTTTRTCSSSAPPMTFPSCRRSLPVPSVSMPCSSSICQAPRRRKRSGICTSTTSVSITHSSAPMTRSGPVPRSAPVAGWPRCSTCH